MRWLTIMTLLPLLPLLPLLLAGPAADAAPAYPPNAEKAIEAATLYRDSRLFEQAKEILVDRILKEPPGEGEQKLRYELGYTLLMEGQRHAAVLQWENLMVDYPHSASGHRAGEMVRELALRVDLRHEMTFRDYFLGREVGRSGQTGHYKKPTALKRDWLDREFLTVLDRYEAWLAEATDPNDKLNILYLNYLLVSGQTNTCYGLGQELTCFDKNRELYHRLTGEELPRPNPNIPGWVEEKKEVPEAMRKAFVAECDRLLAEMEKINPLAWQAVDGYYQMGLLTSDWSFVGGPHLTDLSRGYFRKVLDLVPQDRWGYRQEYARSLLGD